MGYYWSPWSLSGSPLDPFIDRRKALFHHISFITLTEEPIKHHCVLIFHFMICFGWPHLIESCRDMKCQALCLSVCVSKEVMLRGRYDRDAYPSHKQTHKQLSDVRHHWLPRNSLHTVDLLQTNLLSQTIKLSIFRMRTTLMMTFHQASGLHLLWSD